MTIKEQVLNKLLTMTDQQIDRLCDLLNRFNWDLEAILEYLQNEREETA